MVMSAFTPPHPPKLNRAAAGKVAWGGICWLLTVFFCGLPIPFGDVYVHVKMGERIVQTREFAREDVFSYGETKPVESREWLSQVLLYLVHARGGEASLHLLKWVLGVASVLLVFHYARMRGAGWVGANAGVVICAAFSAYFLNMRPRQFSLIGLLLVLILLEKGRSRPWLLLAYLPLRALWMNLHGEVLFGDLLIALYAALGLLQQLFPSLPWNLSTGAGGWRRPAIASCVLFVGLLLDTLHPFRAGRPLEEAPPGFTSAVLSEWSHLQLNHVQNYHVLVYLAASLALFISRLPRLPLFDLAVFSLFWSLPLVAQRMVLDMAVVTIPMVAAWWSNPKSDTRAKKRRELLAVLVTLLLPVYMLAIPHQNLLRQGFDPKRIWRSQNPDTAVSFIRANHLPGRMYNDFDWGDYLIYMLYPDYLVAQDARFTSVYRPGYIHRAMGVQEGARWWKRFLDEYNVSWVLIRPSRPLYALLDKDPDWQWLYEDQQAAIFLRVGEETLPYLEKGVAGKLRYPPSPLFAKHYGQALVRRGFADLGARFLEKAQAALPKDPTIPDTLAIAYRQRGEMERAFQSLQKALAVDPDYAYAHARLALWYWERGNRQQARQHHKRALALDPANPLALRMSPLFKP